MDSEAEDEATVSVLPEFVAFSGVVPSPTVGKGQGGPVPDTDINKNDVLLGRGSMISSHYGNIQLRLLVSRYVTNNYGKKYKWKEKLFEAAKVVDAIRNLKPPGRFMSKFNETRFWEEVGDITARKKVAQAFRDFRYAVMRNVPFHEAENDSNCLMDRFVYSHNKSNMDASRCTNHFNPYIGMQNSKIKTELSTTSASVTQNDILLGRGRASNQHYGNIQFRCIVAENLSYYQNMKKSIVVSKIVDIIRNLNPPGRFLSNNKETGCWEEVEDTIARKKIAQAFRDSGEPKTIGSF